MRIRVLLLAWLACGGVALAQPSSGTVTFYTEPSGAEVRDQFGSLGLSGRALTLRDYHGGQVHLQFVLDGYETETPTVSADQLRHTGYYPIGRGEPGVLRLRPNRPDTWIRTYLAYLLPGVLLGGVGVGWLATAYARRQKERAELAERRAQRIAELADATPRAQSWVSRVVGGYRIVRPLGKGGMATVYEAEPDQEPDCPSERRVAVKIMDVVAEDSELPRRMKREIQLCRQLAHPNVAQLLDWGEVEGQTFLILERVGGGTLRQKVGCEGLPPREVADLLEPVVRAVAYAHARGVIHRDLKPENVLVTEGGALKVTDFGLGRAVDSSVLTRTGSVLGTPAYMAPEQLQGGGFEPATDQYSLGVIAYELLTGSRPFVNPDPLELVLCHLNEPPPPPSSRAAWLSPEVDRVLLRMLAKKPAERFPSVEEAGTALLGALRAES